MSKKPAQVISQLSFHLDKAQTDCPATKSKPVTTDQLTANPTVIPFTGPKKIETSPFRQRVMRDLVRNHVIVD
jgi:hypothetical protein